MPSYLNSLSDFHLQSLAFDLGVANMLTFGFINLVDVLLHVERFQTFDVFDGRVPLDLFVHLIVVNFGK